MCQSLNEKNLPFPVFAGWRSIPKEIWQGQTVAIVLEAQNLTFLAIADSVSLNNVPAGILEEATNFGQITTRYNTDTVIYDLPMASWFWTLAEPGEFEFPGAKFVVNGITRSIQGFSIKVKPLPFKARESGAVGSFSLNADWNNHIYKSGDILSLHLRNSGGR